MHKKIIKVLQLTQKENNWSFLHKSNAADKAKLSVIFQILQDQHNEDQSLKYACQLTKELLFIFFRGLLQTLETIE